VTVEESALWWWPDLMQVADWRTRPETWVEDLHDSAWG
jgi:hypothetical protein